MKYKKRSFEERFWKKVDKKGSDDCWLWKASTIEFGYGHIQWNYKYVNSHRASWMLHFGEIPKGLCVLHKCDNPPCVNPGHLFLGTLSDNAKDRDNKGRGKMQGGEKNPNAKLKESQVFEIRKKYIPNKITAKMLAKEYNVTWKTVRKLLDGYTWKSAY